MKFFGIEINVFHRYPPYSSLLDKSFEKNFENNMMISIRITDKALAIPNSERKMP